MLLRVSLLSCLAFAAIRSPHWRSFSVGCAGKRSAAIGREIKSSASKFADNPDHAERHKVKRDYCSKLSINITPMPGWTEIFWNLPLSKPIAGHLFATTPIFICRARFAPAIGQPDQIHGHAPLWHRRGARTPAGIYRSYFLSGALNEAI